MTIQERIQSIATTLGANYGYGRRSDNNINGDNDTFPMIYLIEPDEVGFVFETGTGNIYDSENCFIQFLDKIEMGDQAKYRVTQLSAMRDLAAQFVEAVVGDHELSLIAQGNKINIRGVVLVDYLDVNCVGIELNLPLSLVYPRSC